MKRNRKQKAESSRQKTESRKQKTKNRKQKAEDDKEIEGNGGIEGKCSKGIKI